MNPKMKKLFFVVIDTNVLVAALLTRHPDSATVQVVELIFNGRLIPLFNREILQEYTEVLHRAKFRIPKHLIDKLLPGAWNFTERAQRKSFPMPKMWSSTK